MGGWRPRWRRSTPALTSISTTSGSVYQWVPTLPSSAPSSCWPRPATRSAGPDLATTMTRTTRPHGPIARCRQWTRPSPGPRPAGCVAFGVYPPSRHSTTTSRTHPEKQADRPVARTAATPRATTITARLSRTGRAEHCPPPTGIPAGGEAGASRCYSRGGTPVTGALPTVLGGNMGSPRRWCNKRECDCTSACISREAWCVLFISRPPLLGWLLSLP
mmetsp:Transcript_9246/g.30591  ORF Transcript_9246/g.30591 Transcript_9246/m.30591 type:complete len:218 (+) Transcript_9246:585-1238(+)